MQKISEKSKKIFNIALLGFYFLFLVSASLHSHNLDLSTASAYNEYNTTSKIVDPFLDGKANCTLGQFLQSQLSQYACSTGLQLFLPVYKNFDPIRYTADIAAPHLTSLQLRAPPQFVS